MAGPKNWHPLALTAAHRLELEYIDSNQNLAKLLTIDNWCEQNLNWCESWCLIRSSAKARSPIERTFLMARVRPSPSTIWQCNNIISFRCIGRDNVWSDDKWQHSQVSDNCDNYSIIHLFVEVAVEVPFVWYSPCICGNAEYLWFRRSHSSG